MSDQQAQELTPEERIDRLVARLAGEHSMAFAHERDELRLEARQLLRLLGVSVQTERPDELLRVLREIASATQGPGGSRKKGAILHRLQEMARKEQVKAVVEMARTAGFTLAADWIETVVYAVPRDASEDLPERPDEGACECGHAPARHRVGDDDGGPGPCRDCDCIVYDEAPADA